MKRLERANAGSDTAFLPTSENFSKLRFRAALSFPTGAPATKLSYWTVIS